MNKNNFWLLDFLFLPAINASVFTRTRSGTPYNLHVRLIAIFESLFSQMFQYYHDFIIKLSFFSILLATLNHPPLFLPILKFIYSEKATKFCEISTLLLSIKVRWRFRKNLWPSQNI